MMKPRRTVHPSSNAATIPGSISVVRKGADGIWRRFPTEAAGAVSDDRTITPGGTMSQHTTRGRAQDRAKVAGGQKHETAYESKKTGATTSDVKDAVKSVGNSRDKVEAELNKSK
jgi:hypothetical protein